MDPLNQLFIEQIHEIYSIPNIGTKLILMKFETMGIVLNSKQIRKLKNDLTKYKGGSFLFNIDFNKEQLKALAIQDKENLQLDFTNSDDEFNKLLRDVERKIKELFQN